MADEWNTVEYKKRRSGSQQNEARQHADSTWANVAKPPANDCNDIARCDNSATTNSNPGPAGTSHQPPTNSDVNHSRISGGGS
ncbi:hypothetical protein SeLEV6574_g08276, partial [Synchytrium endobioticum]